MLISMDDNIEKFYEPVKVQQILEDKPSHFMCSINYLYVGQHISRLLPHQEIHLGQRYFLLHLRKLQFMVSDSDMASLLLKANSAINRITGSGHKSCSKIQCFLICGLAKMGGEEEIGEKYVRRYYCEICGVSRSKRPLLKHHMLFVHGKKGMAIWEKHNRPSSEAEKRLRTVCEHCGASFKKPAHLQQHKLSHSIHRRFACPIDGCDSNYKRQDHLNRHLLKHEGKLFSCPREGCYSQVTTSTNFKRHVKKHQEKGDSWRGRNSKVKEEKKYCCPEPGCRKAFKYPSRLKKHQDDVHCTMEYVEVVCCEPGCLKYFTNAEALKEHLRLSHRHICCEICGSRQLKKQIKRHMRTHASQPSMERIRCHFERCLYSFTTKSNLVQHIKVVHFGLRPYKCRFDGCEMSFGYRAVRDNHEMSGMHRYVQGDFVEEDVIFQSRPRGGRKRKAFKIDSLLRKRISLANQGPALLESSSSLLNWLTSNNRE